MGRAPEGVTLDDFPGHSSGDPDRHEEQRASDLRTLKLLMVLCAVVFVVAVVLGMLFGSPA
jgi:hypothetical protein